MNLKAVYLNTLADISRAQIKLALRSVEVKGEESRARLREVQDHLFEAAHVIEKQLRPERRKSKRG